VRRLLGAGGFGSVYLGHDGQLDRPVAIKVLHGGTGHRADPDRSRQEARRLAQLHHPGIVAVHDIGVHGDIVYIVSDYLEGTDLRRWMQDHRASWQEATRIAIAVLEALGPLPAASSTATSNPRTSFSPPSARRYGDFGLTLSDAQVGGQEGSSLTPHYMSPEQARAGTPHAQRTDLYSLGVVLCEAADGPSAVPGDRRRSWRQVRDDSRSPRQLARDIPPELERVC
jgi:serine/threonine-protein kinase